MTTFLDLLTAPTLWIGATAGGLLSAVITGYFTRNTTSASDQRKADAERDRIDKDAVRDAAIAFATTCQEVQLAATSFRRGILPDVPDDDEKARGYRLKLAQTLTNQVVAARNRVEMIAPRNVIEALWPLGTATINAVTSAFVLLQDDESGEALTSCHRAFVTAVRLYLGKEVVTVQDLAQAMTDMGVSGNPELWHAANGT